MSYEPTNWKTGDIVTSAKLNKLENGVAGAPDIFVVTMTGDEEHPVLDKTFQEVVSAINEGSIVLMKTVGIVFPVGSVERDGNEVTNIVFVGPPVYNGDKFEIYQVNYYTEDGTDRFDISAHYIKVEPN